jgi:hypothetical protein
MNVSFFIKPGTGAMYQILRFLGIKSIAVIALSTVIICYLIPLEGYIFSKSVLKKIYMERSSIIDCFL